MESLTMCERRRKRMDGMLQNKDHQKGTQHKYIL